MKKETKTKYQPNTQLNIKTELNIVITKKTELNTLP